MKLLMPSHVRRVQHYVDPTPIFQRYGVEDQLTAMYQPVVQLKSGGYLVINPTEALVSIDINSGRSTREHNIEQTAFATNLEAAAEIARQLRLRDMAGLVVIDFIDMEQSSHVRKVEKAMKEALKNDRARIQVGRISSFGLMEMSRQRLRTGVLEASTKACPHCEGTGLMRTASSSGLSALRIIEDEAARGRGDRIMLRAGREAAIYVLNKKRAELAEIEERYGVTVEIAIDESVRRRADDGRELGPAPGAEGAPGPAADRRGRGRRYLPEVDEDEAEEAEDEERRDRRDEDEGEREARDGAAVAVGGRGRRRERPRRDGERPRASGEALPRDRRGARRRAEALGAEEEAEAAEASAQAAPWAPRRARPQRPRARPMQRRRADDRARRAADGRPAAVRRAADRRGRGRAGRGGQAQDPPPAARPQEGRAEVSRGEPPRRSPRRSRSRSQARRGQRPSPSAAPRAKKTADDAAGGAQAEPPSRRRSCRSRPKPATRTIPASRAAAGGSGPSARDS